LLIFFSNDSSPTETYTLSLHDALPICPLRPVCTEARVQPRIVLQGFPCAEGKPAAAEDWRRSDDRLPRPQPGSALALCRGVGGRSEEHTSELQSRENLVCRLLLEKKKQ